MSPCPTACPAVLQKCPLGSRSGYTYLSQCIGPGFALYLWLHPLSQILSVVPEMILSLIHLDLCLQLNLGQLHFSYFCCWRNVFEMSFSVAVREVEK